MAVYVELDGAIDTDLLTSALHDLVNRHPSPRAGVDDGPRAVTVEAIDLSGEAHPRDAALRWMKAAGTSGSGSARYVAAHLITVAPEHQILHLSGCPSDPRGRTMSHDGAAVSLIADLAAAYAARRDGLVGARAHGSVRRAGRARSGVAASSGLARAAGDFWSRRLDPLPVPVRLSTGRAPAVSNSLIESRTLSPAVSADMRVAADRCGATVEAVVVAAMTGYLAAVCQSDEILIGLPTFVRPSGQSSSVPTTLPLRLTPPTRPTVADLVAVAEAEITDARAHRQDWVGHPHSDWFSATGAGPVPVVNVIPFLGPVQFGDVDGDVFVLCGGPVGDMRVNVYDAAGSRIRVDLEAHPGLYDAAELRAHHDRFVSYLTRFVAASSSTLLATIDVLSKREHVDIIDRWNATDELITPATLTDLVELGLARDPERAAFCGTSTDDVELTHGELDCRANQMARVLLCEGVGPESVVGVMTTDRVAGIVAMLAVLRAGAAVMPLDPAGDALEIAHRFSCVRPVAVITDRVLADVDLDPDDVLLAPALGDPAHLPALCAHNMVPPWVRVIAFDDPEVDEFADDPIMSDELVAPIRLGNAAWVSFGGNGNGSDNDSDSDNGKVPDARGVVLTHQAVANRLQWRRAQACPTVGVHVLAGASVDAWLWESLLPLTIGVTIDVGPHRADPTVEASGPAEAAFGALAATGRPVWNTQVYVLDAHLRAVPVGAVGELYIAGDQMSRGYAGDPAATGDRLVANPFRPGRRMYRTGGHARWRADGVIEHVTDAATTTPA